MYHYTAYARFLSLPRDLPGALECYQAARRNVHARAQADLPAPLPQEKGFLRAVYAAVTAPRQFLEQAELRMILEDWHGSPMFLIYKDKIFTSSKVCKKMCKDARDF